MRVAQFGVSMEPDNIVDFVDGLLDDIQDSMLREVGPAAAPASRRLCLSHAAPVPSC